MSAQEHIEALRSKHLHLKHEIEEENQRPHPDDLRISELKRQKLRIKDEIALLESEEKRASA
ncbi:MAG: YdcH family protein [Kiloniellales bacterium]|nr:YdcH family protein [Kiloniellales bacterium]